jgi:hypothetical protein
MKAFDAIGVIEASLHPVFRKICFYLNRADLKILVPIKLFYLRVFYSSGVLFD